MECIGAYCIRSPIGAVFRQGRLDLIKPYCAAVGGNGKLDISCGNYLIGSDFYRIEMGSPSTRAGGIRISIAHLCFLHSTCYRSKYAVNRITARNSNILGSPNTPEIFCCIKSIRIGILNSAKIKNKIHSAAYVITNIGFTSISNIRLACNAVQKLFAAVGNIISGRNRCSVVNDNGAVLCGKSSFDLVCPKNPVRGRSNGILDISCGIGFFADI